jgi:hypothetical protein
MGCEFFRNNVIHNLILNIKKGLLLSLEVTLFLLAL